MNKRTHIRLGRILYGFAESELGVQLNKGSFLFGNILPDLYLSFVTKPHTVSHTIELVSQKIKKLIDTKKDNAYCGRSFSRRLGVICHYYADFFCYPHSGFYTGDLKDHVVYEKSLFRYLDAAYGGADAAELCGGLMALSGTEDAETFMMRLQNEYRQTQPSFDQDLRCSILACAQAVVCIAGVTYEEKPGKEELFEPMPQTA